MIKKHAATLNELQRIIMFNLIFFESKGNLTIPFVIC